MDVIKNIYYSYLLQTLIVGFIGTKNYHVIVQSSMKLGDGL
jgi:hypothetical protein